jgi:hypothetical protein
MAERDSNALVFLGIMWDFANLSPLTRGMISRKAAKFAKVRRIPQKDFLGR